MEDLLFSKKHIWIKKLDSEIIRIGITNYAQEKLGSILFLSIPDTGEHLNIDERFGDIESVKTVSDLISPVKGEVVSVNEELVDEPDSINDNPYEAWFIEVKAQKLSSELMAKDKYIEYTGEL